MVAPQLSFDITAMFTYPRLTPFEQADLPQLIASPSAIPNKFEDSTHQLMFCQTVEGDMVLKVCNDATIVNSNFWLGVNHLFAADFPNSLRNIHLTHDFLTQYGGLIVPDFVAASANRFVLARFLPGVDLEELDLEAAQLNDKWIIAIANHIAKLHQRTFTKWGSLHAPQFAAKDWAKRLHETIVKLVAKSDSRMTESLLTEVLSQAKNSQETEFVPMMLDLRWDQLRGLSTDTLALVDLDAFVIAPRALDLVLIEYICTPQQFALFKSTYLTAHDWPDYAAQKSSYQLLLFLMHVLGETDLTRWMNRITR